MGDHIEGRPVGLAPASCESLPFGNAAQRGGRNGVRSGRVRRDTRLDACTVTTMPQPPHSPSGAMSRTFRLDAELSSVATARRHVSAVVNRWGVAIDLDTAILLTSELVANAVIHGSAFGEPVILAVICFGDRLQVEVHDPAGGDSESKRPRMEGESGRGLAIVAALSDFWGWEPTEYGKNVYFSLSVGTEAQAA